MTPRRRPVSARRHRYSPAQARAARRAQLEAVAPAPPVQLRPLLARDRAHERIAAGERPWIPVTASHVAPSGQRIVPGRASWLSPLLGVQR